jgi:arylsulfatase A-like enzyme
MMMNIIYSHLKIRFFLPLILVFCLACTEKENQGKRPNIILIYADDMGIGLLGHEGQQIIKTPNIDKLANEGMRFKNSYSCMLCAPARASLITGYHDSHSPGFEITSAGIYSDIGNGKYSTSEVESKINEVLSPIPEDAVFLGEVAQKSGYTTAQYGKLEWGFAATDKQIKRHGWDTYFGYLDHVRAHGFYPPYLFRNGELIEIDGNTLLNCGKSMEGETQKAFEERWDRTGKNVYSQDIFMDSVLSFINIHKDDPFFLYFPTQLPHGPVSIPTVHKDFENDERLTQIEKEYASMVKMLDDNVGQIMDELKRLKIDNNTIVIFAADNGHEIYYTKKGRVLKPYTNMKTGERFDDFKRKFYSDLGGDVFNGNGGRAGLKRSNLQGGINVPLIIRWPKKIAAQSVSKRLVANYDILPTVAEITGFSDSLRIDGISFFSELVGGSSNLEHEYVVFSSFTGPTLITNDGWKIRCFMAEDAFNLYYLPDDFREDNDLSNVYPEKFNELKNMLLEECDGDFNNGVFSSENQIRL